CDLGDQLAWLPILARWHYDQWGPLTGADSLDRYVTTLTRSGQQSGSVGSHRLAEGDLLGSANLVASDLPPLHVGYTPAILSPVLMASRGAATLSSARANSHGI